MDATDSSNLKHFVANKLHALHYHNASHPYTVRLNYANKQSDEDNEKNYVVVDVIWKEPVQFKEHYDRSKSEYLKIRDILANTAEKQGAKGIVIGEATKGRVTDKLFNKMAVLKYQVTIDESAAGTFRDVIREASKETKRSLDAEANYPSMDMSFEANHIINEVNRDNERPNVNKLKELYLKTKKVLEPLTVPGASEAARQVSSSLLAAFEPAIAEMTSYDNPILDRRDEKLFTKALRGSREEYGFDNMQEMAAESLKRGGLTSREEKLRGRS